MIGRRTTREQIHQAAEGLGLVVVNLRPNTPGDWNGQTWCFRLMAATRGAAFTAKCGGLYPRALDTICLHGYQAFLDRLHHLAPKCSLQMGGGTYRTPDGIKDRFNRPCTCVDSVSPDAAA
jgi:hypothetical protein